MRPVGGVRCSAGAAPSDVFPGNTRRHGRCFPRKTPVYPPNPNSRRCAHCSAIGFHFESWQECDGGRGERFTISGFSPVRKDCYGRRYWPAHPWRVDRPMGQTGAKQAQNYALLHENSHVCAQCYAAVLGHGQPESERPLPHNAQQTAAEVTTIRCTTRHSSLHT